MNLSKSAQQALSLRLEECVLDHKAPSEGDMLTVIELLKQRASLPEHRTRARGVSREWVPCPICAEPDMRRETDEEGNSLVYCVNHACASNGGDNAAGIEERLARVQTLETISATASSGAAPFNEQRLISEVTQAVRSAWQSSVQDIRQILKETLQEHERLYAGHAEGKQR